MLSLSGEASAADYETVLRSLSFSSSDTTNNNQRSLNLAITSSYANDGGVLQLDGSDDYIETLRPAIPMADWTVTVWAQADAAVTANTSDSFTVAQGGGISGESFTLKKTGAGDLTLSDSWTISNAMPADGEWHQYTVVKSGSGANNGTLYIDGVKVGSGQLSDAISGTSLRIGRDHHRQQQRPNQLLGWRHQ